MNKNYADIRAEMLAALRTGDVATIQPLVAELHTEGSDGSIALAGRAIGFMHIEAGRYADAIRVLEEAEHIARRLDPSPDLGHILRNKAHALVWNGQHEEAEKTLDIAMRIFIDEDNADGIYQVLMITGLVHEYRSEWKEALSVFTKAEHHALTNNLTYGVARAQSNIAIVLNHMAHFDEALVYARKSLEYNVANNQHAGAVYSLSALATANYGKGMAAEALSCYLQILDLLEKQPNPRQMAHTYFAIGTLYSTVGEYSSAIEYLERSFEIANSCSAGRVIGYSLAHLGEVYAHIGDPPRVHQKLAEAEDFCRATMLPDVLAYVLTVKARQLIREGLLDEVRLALQEASHLSDQLQSVLVRPFVLITQAELSARSGAYQEVKDVLVQINEINNVPPDVKIRVIQLQKEIAHHERNLDDYVTMSNLYLEAMGAGTGAQSKQKVSNLLSMHRIREERRAQQRQAELLNTVLPADVVARMLRGETVTGDHYANACVMFADIVGFTEHSEHLSPGEVVALLGAIYNVFDDLATTNGVQKLKTMGDAYICYKVDGSGKENAHAVATLATQMLGTSFTWPNGDHVMFRIGIHSGPIVAGIVGTKRLQYDIWGDTVNVASRMESTSEAGRIHVSEALVEAVGSSELFYVESRGRVELKGKGKIPTYWLASGSITTS